MARRLVAADGSALAQDDSHAPAQVSDGSVLRFVGEHGTSAASAAPVASAASAAPRVSAAPRAPMAQHATAYATDPATAYAADPATAYAIDKTADGTADEATDEAADGAPGGPALRGRCWDERSRTWTAGAASVLLALVAGVAAASWYGPGPAALWLGAVAVLAAAGGATAGRLGRRPLGTALLVWGGALGTLASWQAAPAGAVRLAAVGLTVAAALALLGVRTELGRGGLIGAVAVALAVGAWEAALALTGVARTGVVLGVLSVLVLGYLPRLALTAAGLTRLDDRRSGGAPVSRLQVATALGATHRGLAPATLAMAVSVGAAGVLAAGSEDGWSVAAAALLCLVTLSRARAYPLVIEVVALLAAGTAVGVSLVWQGAADGAGAPGALAALCVPAVLPLVVLAVRVPEHVQVRLRRLMNLVESVSVVALIPVALGAFGVFSRLPHTF